MHALAQNLEARMMLEQLRADVDAAHAVRARIATKGGTWALYLRHDGIPLFAQHGDALAESLVHGFFVSTLVGHYDERSKAECIAGDIRQTRKDMGLS